eukprot:1158478-Pelagomonas_calceolata.AAC.6
MTGALPKSRNRKQHAPRHTWGPSRGQGWCCCSCSSPRPSALHLGCCCCCCAAAAAATVAADAGALESAAGAPAMDRLQAGFRTWRHHSPLLHLPPQPCWIDNAAVADGGVGGCAAAAAAADDDDGGALPHPSDFGCVHPP